MGWKINQWSRLIDGNHAYVLFGNLLKNGTADNLWDMHPPFQIDGNFGGTAGVTEMLLQSQTGAIQLLPALPDAWQSGSITGIRARGNFTVDVKWKNGKLTMSKILSGSGAPCTIIYHGIGNMTVKDSHGNTISLMKDSEDKIIFPTTKGESYTICARECHNTSCK